MTHQLEALSIPAFAAQVGVPVNTVRGWVNRKVIPSFLIGRRRLIDMGALRRILAEQRSADSLTQAHEATTQEP